MPFDFQNQGRIEHLLNEIKELRYKNPIDIPGFMWWEDDGTIGNRQPQGEGKTVSRGFRWTGWDRYNWLTASVTVPREWIDEEVVGLFDFGVPVGHGNNGDFESLLYLNGRPYQAMDGNHREVFLEPKENGLELDLKFRVWSGLSGGGIPKDNAMEICRAQIAVLDHPTDDFYYLAQAALETYEILDRNNEYRDWILNTLVKAFIMIDFTEPGSSVFYESVKVAYGFLSGQMDGRGKSDVNVSVVGHTHIDVAWLWRLRHTREKAARSFSTVNRLMEKYGDYVFLQSQPQLYEFIKEDYPDIYEYIKKRVKEGRWEPSGAMWVECDCNIASGESIIRQILVGKNFFRQEFGADSEFLWLPDVFGYSWALPQILKKSGVDTFMTTKISWNDTNKLPYDTFLWRGIDGTEVTSHFITTSDPGAHSYTYNGDTRPYAIKGVWDNYKNKDYNHDLLISYGYGDGGGGPTRDMIKMAEAADRIPGLPHVKQETATEYFRRLNQTIRENPMDGFLPVWDGELYLEFHRGTYTSQAYNKKMNRRMEYLLRDMELQSVLAEKVKGVPYHYEEILKAWKIVLCHQFHDILPGSSIREVYEDSHVEYGRALKLLREVEEAVGTALYTPEEGTFTVFNNSNWARSGMVTIPMNEKQQEMYCGSVVTDEEGKELPVRWQDGCVRVWVKGLKPFAAKVLKICGDDRKNRDKEAAAGGQEADRCRVLKDRDVQQEEKIVCHEKSGSVETQHYLIKWNSCGQLTRIYDKDSEREVLPEGKRGNVLRVFEDKPRCFDAWELESTIDLKKEEIGNLRSVEAERDELGAEIRFVWEYHNSQITQTMCLYEDSRRIDFETVVDWHEHQKLLKTAFPVDVRAVDARFDIQDGNIRRPITRNTTWEMAQFEVVAHKWVDLWETGYGMAVLNDCKYGHDVKEDTIRLTLLKSAVDPDYSADQGTHCFTYAILPHSQEWYQAGIEQQAFFLNNPLMAKAGGTTLGEESWFTFSADTIVVDAVKRRENGDEVVIRFHEYAGGRGKVRMETLLPVAGWCECNLMEEPLEEYKDGAVEVTVKPYEIKSILLRIKK